ncbi:MAG: hypothetical protein LBL13_11245 [Bacteroidales bacterium]|jgi:hypothetical protein|nr:hypothetical protein [Bacteroidales bacterium]
MKRGNIILAFLLCCLFFASCKKDKKHIIGKWKLIEVSIYKNYESFETIDYAGENIIYDFRSTNIVVSGNVPDDLFIFNNFQPGKHHCKYKKVLIVCPTCDYDYGYSDPNLLIDKLHYFCVVDLDDGTMWLSTTIESERRIDGDHYRWTKRFIKIK